MEADILFTKYSWNALRMFKGTKYQASFSKQVVKSVSHDQSPCNEKKIGVERACHEFKVMTQMAGEICSFDIKAYI